MHTPAGGAGEESNPKFHYVIDSVHNEPVLAELVNRCDLAYHLAAAVGSFFPAGPELVGNDPDQFVEQIESWPRMSTSQNGEMLPKRKILQHNLPTATKKANEYSEPEQKQVYMSQGYSRLPSEPWL